MIKTDTNGQSISMHKPEQHPEQVFIDRLGKKYRPVKCRSCGWTLLYEFIFRGRIAVKCPNCAMLTVMVFRHDKKPK